MAKVFLSAGHGGSDPGAVAYGLKEKDINLNTLLACNEVLVQHGITTVLSRVKDEDDPVSQETREANNSRADLAVSFHANADGGDGFEAFYYSSSKEGKKLAQLGEKYVKQLGQNSRGIKSGNHLYFIRNTRMPAVLFESFFVDNDRDNDIADTVSEQRAFGVAYAKAILEYFGISYKNPDSKPDGGTDKIKAIELENMKEADIIAKIGPLFTADQKKSGILASVSLAQFILESAYGKSELAQNANNCFGMKTNLSGNTWPGSSWNGEKYTKKTQEFVNGQYITVTADFRKYPYINDSIADHSAYLNGAMNGSVKRYAGLKGCADHEKALRIIKDGGYATSPTYVEKLLNVINKWGLKKYDYVSSVPFLVKVDITDLNIRTGPGTNYAKTGETTGIGKFTITEVKNGKGSTAGWGKLKSGAGWISLDFAKRI